MAVAKSDGIVAVGTIGIDTVETPYGKAEEAMGGSGTFFAIAGSLLAPVNLVSLVGTDFDRWAEFDRPGLDTEGVKVVEGDTFRWGGKYHDDINKRDTTFTDLGVIADNLPDVPESYRACRTVCLANVDPPQQLMVLDALDNPDLVVADTMNFWISSDRENLEKVIARSNVLILNDDEGRQLTGKLNVTDILLDIQRMGPEYVVLKKGEHGALLALGDEYFAVPGYPLLRVVDPTGAGDTFAAGFTAWLHRTGDKSAESMKTAAVYGSAMASFCCEDFSTRRLQEITIDDIENRVEKFRRLVRFN
ncbi:MAG: sugar kinase [Candidatus Glassbacteria bacterium]|nr:sugar kinase [Candidatus Glassbacteria bacterium]